MGSARVCVVALTQRAREQQVLTSSLALARARARTTTAPTSRACARRPGRARAHTRPARVCRAIEVCIHSQVEMVGVVRLLEAGEWWSEARGFPLTTVIGLDSVGLARDDWQSARQQCARLSAERDFGSQLDAWTSGLGHWEVCGLDDDDDMYEPNAWHHSEALDDWDA